MKTTEDILNALKLALEAEVILKMEIEKFEPVKQKVFSQFYFVSDFTGDKITTPENIYEDGDGEKAKLYFNALHNAYIEAGAKGLKEVGYCPILIAENLLRKANRLFSEKCFNYIKETTNTMNGIEFEDLLCDLDDYKEFTQIQKQYYSQFLQIRKFQRDLKVKQPKQIKYNTILYNDDSGEDNGLDFCTLREAKKYASEKMKEGIERVSIFKSNRLIREYINELRL